MKIENSVEEIKNWVRTECASVLLMFFVVKYLMFTRPWKRNASKVHTVKRLDKTPLNEEKKVRKIGTVLL